MEITTHTGSTHDAQVTEDVDTTYDPHGQRVYVITVRHRVSRREVLRMRTFNKDEAMTIGDDLIRFLGDIPESN